MKDKSLTDSLSELNDVVKQYVNARIHLVQVILLDKFTKAITFIIITVIIIMTASFVLLLLALAFSYWYSQSYGSLIEGFLISAGIYVVIMLIVFWLRKPLISNAIIKDFSKMLFNDQEKESE